jgi:anti-sigma B factor antagonist
VSETGLDGMLDVDTWLDGGRSVVELAGELDVYSVSRLRDAFTQLPREGKHRIAVEMSRLDFIDSSGLGVLVGAMKQARALGGGVCLVGAPERILKTFRITGLVRIIPAFTGLEEAFAWLDSLHA